VAASPDTPLLYVLHNELHLHGPRFGCGLAQCGACSVLADGKEIRSCVTPVAGVAGKKVTTLEGLPALYAQQKRLAKAPELHPLQQAWIDEQPEPRAQLGVEHGRQGAAPGGLLHRPEPDRRRLDRVRPAVARRLSVRRLRGRLCGHRPDGR
jgi:hypothetical protein